MQSRRFILQALDPEYGHPAFETMFVVERPDELRTLLGEVADEDPDLEMSYTLAPADVAAINRHFGLFFDPEGRKASLYQWARSREAPYLVHTGYELVLMLDGRKKFARMSTEYPARHEGEDRFDRYVARGVLHKEVELEKFAEPVRLQDGRLLEGFRTAYYTLSGEEWRIPAWKLILKASRKLSWSEDFERLEGMLFGYEDWQSDWWIEDVRKRRVLFGSFLVYVAVNASDLADIEMSDWRALPRPKSAIKLFVTASEEPDDEVQQLMVGTEAFALVKFKVKARSFRKLVDKGGRMHELPPERIKDLNRCIVGDIEIATGVAGAVSLSNT
jgi:hypothetical protein